MAAALQSDVVVSVSAKDARGLLESAIEADETLSRVAVARTTVPVVVTLGLLFAPFVVVVAIVVAAAGANGRPSPWVLVITVLAAGAAVALGGWVGRRVGPIHLVGLTNRRLLIARLGRRRPPTAVRRWDYALTSLAAIPVSWRVVVTGVAGTGPFLGRLMIPDPRHPLRLDFGAWFAEGNEAESRAIFEAMTAGGRGRA